MPPFKEIRIAWLHSTPLCQCRRICIRTPLPLTWQAPRAGIYPRVLLTSRNFFAKINRLPDSVRQITPRASQDIKKCRIDREGVVLSFSRPTDGRLRGPSD